MAVGSGWTVLVGGFCALRPDEVLARVVAGGIEALGHPAGEYVIAVEHATSGQTWLVSSDHGFVPWYYAVVARKLVHGPTVREVMDRAGLPFEWNWRAVGDFFSYGHAMGEDSMHPRVVRVPIASVVHARAGNVDIQQRDYDVIHPIRPHTADEAVEAFNRSVGRWLNEAPAVSMSGGLDARVVLSALLKLGARPALLSGGQNGAHDVEIPRSIADQLGLNFVHVALDVDDYLQVGDLAVRLTGGSKAAHHWHTLLYPLKSGFGRDQLLYVGNAGEFARTQRLRIGSVVHALAPLPGGRTHELYWRIALPSHPFRSNEVSAMSGALGAQLVRAAHRDRATRMAQRSVGAFLDGLDRFTLQERPRGFQGLGYQLYAHSTSPRMPFVDTDWATAARGLPRRIRLGSNWHRYCIQKNAPKLMNFPEGSRYARVPEKAPAFWWLHMAQRRDVPYADYAAWFRSSRILDWLLDHRGSLQELIPPPLLEKMLQEQRDQGGRHGLVGSLLALAFWRNTGDGRAPSTENEQPRFST
jgi:asparagine synthase (glutamine-hydrolysing)